MPRMSENNLSVAANAVSANRLSGLLHEFLDGPAGITLGAACAEVGLNVTLLVGGVSLIHDGAVSQINRFPQLPEDIAVQEIVNAGRMVLTFRNTTGAAIIVNWLMDVDYNV